MDDIPRRNKIDCWTPAELAIGLAMETVEKIAADERLTDAILLLASAKHSVADYLEGVNTRRHVVSDLSDVSELSGLARDARRWRALMSSERVHWLGSAGFDHKDGVATPRPGEVWHFGIEFWSSYVFDKSKYPDATARNMLTAYADAMGMVKGGGNAQ